jgi:hypothetical protein
MPYNGEAIAYRFKHFDLPSDTTMLCVSVDEPDIAPLEGDKGLWGKFLANAVARHKRGKTLGILKIGDQTFVPKPIAGVPSAEWPLAEQFNNDRLADDEENWPIDSGNAVR